MKWWKLKNILPGVTLSLMLGAAVWISAGRWSWSTPLVIGILLGMALRTAIGERPMLKPGLDWAPTFLIPPGIIFYGAGLRFDFRVVPPLVWLQIFIGIIIVVWICNSLGRILKVESPVSLLVAVGTAICGASAIMIARSTVEGNNRDTAKALLVITVWGLLGLIGLPYLAKLLDMNTAAQAQLYATTLHQTGLVKAAASHVSQTCLDTAMTIKIARTMMIIPLLLAVGTISHFQTFKKPEDKYQKFKVRIPWYLWGFVAAGLMFSFIPRLYPLAPYVSRTSSLLWTMAMVSIGLTVDIREILNSLGRPLLVGLGAWLALLGVFFYTYINTLN